jgi:alkylhydroperoxidase family enzyme
VRRGATEALVAKLADYEASDLPERTKAALRLADRLLAPDPRIDPAFHTALKAVFTDDELLDLAMTVAFFSGWQRVNEAFGILPDHWREGDPPPFGPLPPPAV